MKDKLFPPSVSESNAMPHLHRPGLLMLDMDSTLITCECIDEIAKFTGVKDQVGELNDRAMRGEMDFSESLLACLQLLAGTDAKVLEDVYATHVRLSDGAEELIDTLQRHDWKIGIVSGGFTFFTERLKQRLNLDFAHSNCLEISHGKITGRLIGDITNAQSKGVWLLKHAAEYCIPLSQTVAVGDGANDLPMLRQAALGIAYYAKPAVRAEANAVIEHGGLEQVLTFINKSS